MIKKVIKLLVSKLGYEIKKIDSVYKNNKEIYNKYQSKYCHLLSTINKNDKNIKIKLHFGCGPRVLKGWINIDLAYEPYENYLKYYGEKYYPMELRGSKGEFYIFDIKKEKLPFPDNFVDVIFHEDFIEHLNQKDQIIFLAETRRVLKKGSVCRVNTPNLLKSMEKNSNFNNGFNGVYTTEWDKNNHLNVLTPRIIEEMAYMVGYSNVVFNSRNNSISKLIPLEYRPDLNDREEDGNIFVDLIK